MRFLEPNSFVHERVALTIVIRTGCCSGRSATRKDITLGGAFMRTVLSTPQGPCQAGIGEFGGVGKSGDVERTRSTRAGALHDVEVDHRRFHTGVAHEVLHSANVSAALE